MANTKPLIWKRLEYWKVGHYCALVKEVEDAAMEDRWGTVGDTPFNIESAGRKYKLMLKSGKIRGVVRIFTGREMGGLYRPHNKCTKTGDNVIDVL